MATNPWGGFTGQQGALGTMANWDSASAGQKQSMQSPLYNGYGGKDATAYDPSANAELTRLNSMPTLPQGQYYDPQGKAQTNDTWGGMSTSMQTQQTPWQGTGGSAAPPGPMQNADATGQLYGPKTTVSYAPGMGPQGRGGLGGGVVGGAGSGMGYVGADGPSPGGGGGYTQGGNPYLSQMADEIGRRSQQGLGQSFNQIRSNAVGVGGLGGSRQGVAEGVATGAANDALTGNLSALFSGQYNADANRGLQQYQGDQNNSTQRYGMDLGYDVNKENLRNQFYLGNRGQDIQSAAVGGDLVSKGMQGPWNSIQGANGVYSPYANGANGNTNSGNSGSNWQTILGGLGSGAQFAKNMGWY